MSRWGWENMKTVPKQGLSEQNQETLGFNEGALSVYNLFMEGNRPMWRIRPGLVKKSMVPTGYKAVAGKFVLGEDEKAYSAEEIEAVVAKQVPVFEIDSVRHVFHDYFGNDNVWGDVTDIEQYHIVAYIKNGDLTVEVWEDDRLVLQQGVSTGNSFYTDQVMVRTQGAYAYVFVGFYDNVAAEHRVEIVRVDLNALTVDFSYWQIGPYEYTWDVYVDDVEAVIAFREPGSGTKVVALNLQAKTTSTLASLSTYTYKQHALARVDTGKFMFFGLCDGSIGTGNEVHVEVVGYTPTLGEPEINYSQHIYHIDAIGAGGKVYLQQAERHAKVWTINSSTGEPEGSCIAPFWIPASKLQVVNGKLVSVLGWHEKFAVTALAGAGGATQFNPTPVNRFGMLVEWNSFAVFSYDTNPGYEVEETETLEEENYSARPFIQSRVETYLLGFKDFMASGANHVTNWISPAGRVALFMTNLRGVAIELDEVVHGIDIVRFVTNLRGLRESDSIKGLQLNAGGIPLLYDMASVTEFYWNHPPSVTVNVTRDTPAGDPDTFILITATYIWTDAVGRMYESAPATPAKVEYNSGDVGVTVKVDVPEHMLTMKDGCVVRIYATEPNSSDFYLLDESKYYWVIPYYTQTFSVHPTIKLKDLLLYTTGGILANDTLPACNDVTVAGDRVYWLSGEDPSIVWITKPSLGPSTEILMEVVGIGRAIEAVDHNVVIGTDKGIMVVQGTPPDNTGRGSTLVGPTLLHNYGHVRYPTGAQRIPAGAFLMTVRGLLFIDRSLAVHPIGQDVIHSLSPTTNVVYTAHHAEWGMVQWLLNSNNSVVFFYETGKWASWRYLADFNSVGIAEGILYGDLVRFGYSSSKNSDDGEAIVAMFMPGWIGSGVDDLRVRAVEWSLDGGVPLQVQLGENVNGTLYSGTWTSGSDITTVDGTARIRRMVKRQRAAKVAPYLQIAVDDSVSGKIVLSGIDIEYKSKGSMALVKESADV